MKKKSRKSDVVRDMLADARHIPGVEQANAEDIRKADEKLKRWERSFKGVGGRVSDDQKSERWRSYLVEELRLRGVPVGAVAVSAAAGKEGAVFWPLTHFSFMPGEADSELCGNADAGGAVSGELADVDCAECLARVRELARIGAKAQSSGVHSCTCKVCADSIESKDAEIAALNVSLEQMTDRANDSDSEVCRLRAKRQTLARALASAADALKELAESEDRSV